MMMVKKWRFWISIFYGRLIPKQKAMNNRSSKIAHDTPHQRCFKNKKSFLGIKFFGRHKYRIVKILTADGQYFVVDKECVRCGHPTAKHFVTRKELVRAGITDDQFNEASSLFGATILK